MTSTVDPQDFNNLADFGVPVSDDGNNSNSDTTTPSSVADASTASTSVIDTTELAKSVVQHAAAVRVKSNTGLTPMSAMEMDLAASDFSTTGMLGGEPIDMTALDIEPLVSPNMSSPEAEIGKRHYRKNKKKKYKKKSDNGLPKRKNKPRAINHVPGISQRVPIVGGRVRPEPHSSLNDEVLMTIFGILYTRDTESKGMTVKKICDILIAEHPEMAKLSSKTSNLVSAKLNAYVKRIEKGDDTMKYALSRVWANTSPRRMVYIYRGILAPEYPQFVHTAIDKLRAEHAAQMQAESGMSLPDLPENAVTPARPATQSSATTTNHKKHKVGRKPKSATMTSTSGSPGGKIGEQKVSHGVEDSSSSPFEAGDRNSPLAPIMQDNLVESPSFSMEMPHFSVPYSAAPVTASLNTPISDTISGSSAMELSTTAPSSTSPWLSLLDESDTDEDEKEVFDVLRRRPSVAGAVPSTLGKRSKSMSFIQSKRPCTAAAAKAAAGTATSARGSDISPTRVTRKSPLAMAVPPLRAAALSGISSAVRDSVTGTREARRSSASQGCPLMSNSWLQTVRSGFLSQEVKSPEDVSLAELDVMFA